MLLHIISLFLFFGRIPAAGEQGPDVPHGMHFGHVFLPLHSPNGPPCYPSGLSISETALCGLEEAPRVAHQVAAHRICETSRKRDT